ncbi:MAG: hypothetical protein C9356_13415 [Oleiphilus sp.]|nr:MAG: hypothetical protein C9356_13415 [Oleiphilus sp.]
MYKKRILGLAIASTLTLSGCLDNQKVVDTSNAGAQTIPESDPPRLESEIGVYPIFDPATSSLPIPNDLIFDSVAGDGTFSVTDSSPPVTTALNSLSGASTVAPIDIAMSGLIDEATVDAAPFTLDASGNPVANPTQNVFLLELAYASGSPVQGLQISEPPTIVTPTSVTYTAEVKTLDGTSFIRINPTTPLNPLTRYVVAITDGIKDLEGNPIHGNPGVTGYETLTDEEAELASSALAPVKSLINDLWEPLALSYFAVATNPSRADDTLPVLTEALPALDDSNIALTYSFTTSGDEKVLNYIADPAQWFNDQLTTFLRLSAAEAAIEAGASDYATVNAAANGAVTAFPSAEIQAALNPLFAAAPPAGCQGLTGSTAIGCVAVALSSAPSSSGGFADLLPTPASATDISFDTANTTDINLVSSLISNLSIPFGEVSVTQGEMTIPYYLSSDDSNTDLASAALVVDSWEADDTLAGAINTAFSALGLEIPQADPTVSTKVNYIFPFPKKQADVTIPVLAIHPTNPAGTLKTVIYQHGLSGDRSVALTFGGSMVAASLANNPGTTADDLAVIAIDHPLHGIGGYSSSDQETLATSLLDAAGTIDASDGISSSEQDTIDAVVAGLFSAGLVQTIDTVTNGFGAACVDLGTNGLATTTTQILGGACDGDGAVTGALGQTASTAVLGAQVLERTVAFGGSTIPGLAVGSADERHFGFVRRDPSGAPVAMEFDGDKADNSSGSMFINLTSFLTTRDNLRQHTLDLLALRKSFGDANFDLNGAAANGDISTSDVYYFGHSLGTLTGIPFVAVANDGNALSPTAATDDIVAANYLAPGGGIIRFIENSPTIAPTILAGLEVSSGLTQDTSSLQAYLNVFQATLDSADPINFVQSFSSVNDDIPVLFSEVIGDTVIPNSVDEDSELYTSILPTGTVADGSRSFLSGTDPLIVEAGAETISSGGGSGGSQLHVEYLANGGVVNHGTPAFPSTGTTAEANAFTEMVTQGYLLTTGGFTVVNGTVLD